MEICDRDDGSIPEEMMSILHDLTKWVRRLAIHRHALKVGDVAPQFLLPGSRGDVLSSRKLLADGPLIINFLHGDWCPFCISNLRALETLPETIKHQYANLLVVTSELDQLSRHFQNRTLRTDIHFMTDIASGLGLAYGVVFVVPKKIQERLVRTGVDLTMKQRSTIVTLYLPATYIVDRNGIIRHASVEPDFAYRVQGNSIVSALQKMAGSSLADH